MISEIQENEKKI